MSSVEEVQKMISSHRRKRGTAKGSITRIRNRLLELSKVKDSHTIVCHAKLLLTKLETLDNDFKSCHLALIELIENEETLEQEQVEMDKHDDELTELTIAVQQLITTHSLPDDSGRRKTVSRQLAGIEANISNIIISLTSVKDVCILQLKEEEVKECKADLSDLRKELMMLDLKDDDELKVKMVMTEKALFDCSLKIRRELFVTTSDLVKSAGDSGLEGSTMTAGTTRSVRLPQIEVPTFDGNILHWRTFWEQFHVAVHNRDDISDSEKLVYLRCSLKDSKALKAIEGLSRSGEHYVEAIELLKARFDRPRLIHQTHVNCILSTPSLKEGNGRELRQLHDTVQQHLRALKAMDYDPSGPFITSALELKLDTTTMFEWQKHSQTSIEVPHYRDLLAFIDLRAQASETSTKVSSNQAGVNRDSKKHTVSSSTQHPSFITAASTPQRTGMYTSTNCVACNDGTKHPLYTCSKFKVLSHDNKMSLLRNSKLCHNCLKPGHFARMCKSSHCCKICHKPHHTLLHVEHNGTVAPTSTSLPVNPVPDIQSHTASSTMSNNALLMTCHILVQSPGGSSTAARAVLDSASSASFISERLAQTLSLPRSCRVSSISGIGGMTSKSTLQSVTQFHVSSLTDSTKKISVDAIVIPLVTCDLPTSPVNIQKWDYISDLSLADPSFNCPGRIDVLLGVDVFVNSLMQGRRTGPSGCPVALQTEFGWVLAGGVNGSPRNDVVYHVTTVSGNDMLKKFWEIEEHHSNNDLTLTIEEKYVMEHFNTNHLRDENGLFIVPLPRVPNSPRLGESKSSAVRRYLSLERSLKSNGRMKEFQAVMEEYIQLGHAESVPLDLQKTDSESFYLPMHVVIKESSTTTKVRVVFDASAKSSTGVSLNDTLMIGPTVHAPLVDVLLKFRYHRYALTTDVSKMYRAVKLAPTDRDYHRFLWRKENNEPLKEYRMTRLTFGVSASSFAANMAIKQNALDLSLQYPLAAQRVLEAFYVDDGLTGASSITEAINLQRQLQELFQRGGFTLRKWNTNQPEILEHLPPELKETKSTQVIAEDDQYTKTLGIEWNSISDNFRVTVPEINHHDDDIVTKRILISDVSKTFDILGWFSPTIIKAKILFQKLWELKIDWDDPIPSDIRQSWVQWRSELPILSTKLVHRCYLPPGVIVKSAQLHGFSDASENAYSAVVYYRFEDTVGNFHTSLIISKTKVAPIKRISIPRLELCGAYLLADLLDHVKELFNIPMSDTYAWTDSTIVLDWLDGSPRRFKVFVGNRVSHIIDLIPPERWNHVKGDENPADCASRGLFPSELIDHKIWWTGPWWLMKDTSEWPKLYYTSQNDRLSEELKDVTLLSNIYSINPVIPTDQFSDFHHLKRVTAWMLRFIDGCCKRSQEQLGKSKSSLILSVEELELAERYWIKVVQETHFAKEVSLIKRHKPIPKGSSLTTLHPFVDTNGILRLSGRIGYSNLGYNQLHPIILHGKHRITKLIIRFEHLRLLHAGVTLLMSSIGLRFHIIGGKKIIRDIVRACVTCRRYSSRPQPQIMGQLPQERVTPGLIFDKVGIDYAGPIYVKYGYVRKPTVVKAYICVFVSLNVKAVHLELVSDLTSEAFIACLRRFISRRGKPSVIWSDHGTNFVGADGELKKILDFLNEQRNNGKISEFCSSQKIDWSFIPERAPHFGGLWEAAVKSLKTHLKKITIDVKLTFEEACTLLSQIEACLNSRPLVALSSDDEGIEALTPGHFIIGRPLEALPDPSSSFQTISILRRWNLVQKLLRLFWKRWSSEYILSLRKYSKWHNIHRSIEIGDIVVIHEDNLIPTKWPLARVIDVHPGKDKVVRVVSVKTHQGTYKRPITKIALLLAHDETS